MSGTNEKNSGNRRRRRGLSQAMAQTDADVSRQGSSSLPLSRKARRQAEEAERVTASEQIPVVPPAPQPVPELVVTDPVIPVRFTPEVYEPEWMSFTGSHNFSESTDNSDATSRWYTGESPVVAGPSGFAPPETSSFFVDEIERAPGDSGSAPVRAARELAASEAWPDASVTDDHTSRDVAKRLAEQTGHTSTTGRLRRIRDAKPVNFDDPLPTPAGPSRGDGSFDDIIGGREAVGYADVEFSFVPQAPDYSGVSSPVSSQSRTVSEESSDRLFRPVGVGDSGGSRDAVKRAAPKDDDDEPPLRSAPTAGRNLPAAIAVGVGLGGLVAASLLWRTELFLLVICAAVVVSLWELSVAVAEIGREVMIIPLSVGGVGMVISAFIAHDAGLLVALTLTVFGLILWRVIDGVDAALPDIATSIFLATYVPFLASFAALMVRSNATGQNQVIVFMVVAISSDIGGYIAGRLFGRHQLAPKVSPKKTWEGLAGSVLLCVVAGVVGMTVLLRGSWVAGAAIGVAIALAATIGDVVESLLKRDIGIKDMSSFLPGHGGLMDRMDSLLFSAPVALVLFRLVL